MLQFKTLQGGTYTFEKLDNAFEYGKLLMWQVKGLLKAAINDVYNDFNADFLNEVKLYLNNKTADIKQSESNSGLFNNDGERVRFSDKEKTYYKSIFAAFNELTGAVDKETVKLEKNLEKITKISEKNCYIKGEEILRYKTGMMASCSCMFNAVNPFDAVNEIKDAFGFDVHNFINFTGYKAVVEKSVIKSLLKQKPEFSTGKIKEIYIDCGTMQAVPKNTAVEMYINNKSDIFCFDYKLLKIVLEFMMLSDTGNIHIYISKNDRNYYLMLQSGEYYSVLLPLNIENTKAKEIPTQEIEEIKEIEEMKNQEITVKYNNEVVARPTIEDIINLFDCLEIGTRKKGSQKTAKTVVDYVKSCRVIEFFIDGGFKSYVLLKDSTITDRTAEMNAIEKVQKSVKEDALKALIKHADTLKTCIINAVDVYPEIFRAAYLAEILTRNFNAVNPFEMVVETVSDAEEIETQETVEPDYFNGYDNPYNTDDVIDDFNVNTEIIQESNVILTVNAEPPIQAANSVVHYELNADKNGVEIYFDEKPTAEIISSLKALGFRWHGMGKYWYAKQNDDTIALAETLSNGTAPKNQSYQAVKKFFSEYFTAVIDNNMLTVTFNGYDKDKKIIGCPKSIKSEFQSVGIRYIADNVKKGKVTDAVMNLLEKYAKLEIAEIAA